MTPATPVSSPPRPVAPAPVPPPAEATVVDRGTVRREQLRAGRWAVRGIAKVAHEVRVDVARLDGTVVVGDRLVAREVSLRGRLDAQGEVVVDGRLRSRGKVDAGGAVRAHEATVVGSVRVAGELTVATTLRVRGQLHAPAVRCDRLEIRGSATVPGAIVATSMDARLDTDSTFGLLQCGEVRLRGPAPNVVRRVLGRDAWVMVDRIEAERVEVEFARVRFVRSNEVVLGRGAHVATVEGTVRRAHPSSRVGPESWSRPPEGLTR